MVFSLYMCGNIYTGNESVCFNKNTSSIYVSINAGIYENKMHTHSLWISPYPTGPLNLPKFLCISSSTPTERSSRPRIYASTCASMEHLHTLILSPAHRPLHASQHQYHLQRSGDARGTSCALAAAELDP